MKYFVYILRCSDNSLYTGITTNLKRRINEHNGKSKNKNAGAKYTASRQPVKLVYSEEFENRSLALKEELRIKKLSKEKKESIVTKSIDLVTIDDI
jgi:putative endonuclease